MPEAFMGEINFPRYMAGSLVVDTFAHSWYFRKFFWSGTTILNYSNYHKGAVGDYITSGPVATSEVHIHDKCNGNILT